MLINYIFIYFPHNREYHIYKTLKWKQQKIWSIGRPIKRLIKVATEESRILHLLTKNLDMFLQAHKLIKCNISKKKIYIIFVKQNTHFTLMKL